MRTRHSPRLRGATLVEAMITMVILLVGLTGLMSFPIGVSKLNNTARRVRQASALLSDLDHNVHRWGYADPRLKAAIAVTDLNDSQVTSRREMGYAAKTSVLQGFAEQPSDVNAQTSSATTLNGAVFQGLNPDVDGDGRAEYQRYWTPFSVSLTGGSMPDGTLVLMVVRWKEPGGSYRQVSATSFVANPGAVAQ